MNDNETEVRLLSAFLHDRHLLSVALGAGFHPDLLPSGPARRLAKALLDLHATIGATLDDSTLRLLLIERGVLTPELEQYLNQVATAIPLDAGTSMMRIEMLEARKSREMLAELHEELGTFLRREDSRHRDLLEITSDAMGRLVEIQRQRTRRQVRPVADAFDPLMHVGPAAANGLLGYSIKPFDRLNAVLSGLRRGFYYALAGAPRRGKTNLALDLARFVATNHRIPVLYYTWEQTRRILAARLVAKEIGVNPSAILAGGDASVEGMVGDARESLMQYGPYLHLVEAGRKETLDQIRIHAHNLMQEFQTHEIVLFFDYLQKIPLANHFDDWKARTDRISTELAELSLELNCPIFAISPLDKEGCRLDERPADEEEQFDPYNRPTMHHAMGSGDLEYDLDVAMVLAKDWRATNDLRQIIENRAAAEGIDVAGLPPVDIMSVYVDKNRDAPDSAATTVQFAFFVTLNKFVELDYKQDREFRPDYHSFSRMQDIYAYLRAHGYGPKPPEPVPQHAPRLLKS